jgi:hypothetical protein
MLFAALLLPLQLFIIRVGILTVIGAVFIWGGIALHNALVSRPESRVPRPGFSKYCQISLTVGLVEALAVFLAARLDLGLWRLLPAGKLAAELAIFVLFLPVSFLLMSAMISALLPTTLARGILVSLCTFAVWIIFGFIVNIAVGLKFIQI